MAGEKGLEFFQKGPYSLTRIALNYATIDDESMEETSHLSVSHI